MNGWSVRLFDLLNDWLVCMGLTDWEKFGPLVGLWGFSPRLVGWLVTLLVSLVGARPVAEIFGALVGLRLFAPRPEVFQLFSLAAWLGVLTRQYVNTHTWKEVVFSFYIVVCRSGQPTQRCSIERGRVGA